MEIMLFYNGTLKLILDELRKIVSEIYIDNQAQ